ncbi:BTB/POZ protein [Gigaspora rosea]|uniref:BTB/POZ protein n=1 Tax=Gigaspora rosea TaxID=44941 RepID=A0A397VIN2_9GLOM|nr:BTB/POZ protein [Gigaspora rosea]CAG8448020.1 24268_t:CDS:2 [Gigaspora rosea]
MTNGDLTCNNTSESSMNDASSREKSIILNVGGIKYETYRSTLVAYPETYLGTMFADRNVELLNPINEKEYFIDRDGNLFRYIIQFYRTGKIYWPLSKNNLQYYLESESKSTTPITIQELEDELDFYQIPFNKQEISSNIIVEKLDNFVAALIKVAKEVIATHETEVIITFSRNGWPPFYKFGQPYVKESSIMETVDKIIKPFGTVGYKLLNKYGINIGRHLQHKIKNLSWQSGYSQSREQLKICMSVNITLDDKEVLKASCLHAD